MIRYSSKVTIDRPPHEVFAALVDVDRFDQWTPMIDARWETPGEPRVGTRGTFRLSEGPINGLLRTEVIELVPDRRVAFRIEHPVLEWTVVSSVEPSGNGTTLDFAGEMRLRGWRRLLEPLLAREVRAGEQKEAERLKALLEGGGAARAAASA